MNKLLKLFYDNKKVIYRTIGIIVLTLIIIQILNQFTKAKVSKQIEEQKNNIDSGNTTTIDNSNYLINNNKNVKTSTNNTIKNTLDLFVNYCNNGQVENAYSMLTDDCKNELFQTVEIFKTNYYDKVFNEKKTYTMQAWDKTDNRIVYQILFEGDILETGMSGKKQEDFYTFIKQSDGSYKISINSYIYRQEFNGVNNTENGIGVKVIAKDVYRSYVIYEFQIFNNSDNSIMIDNDKITKTIYLIDDSNIKYSSIENSLITKGEIVLQPGSNRKYKVKFNKAYNSNVQETSLVLSNIVMNYDEYKNSTDTENYTNRISIKVKLN